MATAEKQYLLDLASEASDDHPIQSVLRGPSHGGSRLFYTGLDDPNPTLGAVLRKSESDVAERRFAICVAENICPEYIGLLGTAWSINHSFFLNYATNPSGDSLWPDVMGWEARERLWRKSGLRDRPGALAVEFVVKSIHLEGVIPHLQPSKLQSRQCRFKRRFEEDSGYYGVQSNTRISYHRVSRYLYLFLVDTPLAMKLDEEYLLPSRLSLWVPCSRNRGGLPIPQLYSKPYFSLFESLQGFLSHAWCFDILFVGDGPINSVVFSYLLAASLWQTNIHYLNNEIKKIAFKDIRRPNITINDLLHDRRQDLDSLRSQVSMAKEWIYPDVGDWLTENVITFVKKPSDQLEEVYAESTDLERFLMDTFQLLMSSISVIDSHTSIEQAKRGTQLTILATIYVPLSFVTGIYGMNVLEINDSGHHIWVFVVTLIVVAICTAALLWVMGLIQDKVMQPKSRDQKAALARA